MNSCRITHVRYVGLGVQDLGDQLEFYRDAWGLAERDTDRDLAFLGSDAATDPYLLRLRETDADRLDVVSFAVPTADDVDWYAGRLLEADVQLISKPHEVNMPGGGYGFRFFDGDGRTLEIASEVTPSEAREFEPREWQPTKLSHVVLNSDDLEATTRWYQRHLGLQISDRLEDVMVFLHGDSPWHHTLALAKNEYVSVNHVAYETLGIDEYLRATGRLMRAGLPCVWGPGRHGPGDNTFAYFQDRGGFVVEYTTALQYVEDWSQWTPRVHPITPEWSDQWGTACARDPEPFKGKPEPSLFVPPPV